MPVLPSDNYNSISVLTYIKGDIYFKDMSQMYYVEYWLEWNLHNLGKSYYEIRQR